MSFWIASETRYDVARLSDLHGGHPALRGLPREDRFLPNAGNSRAFSILTARGGGLAGI
jgi:hypothetical protein